jgi:hypothetical protein
LVFDGLLFLENKRIWERKGQGFLIKKESRENP